MQSKRKRRSTRIESSIPIVVRFSSEQLQWLQAHVGTLGFTVPEVIRTVVIQRFTSGKD